MTSGSAAISRVTPISSGKRSARTLTRARTLLKAGQADGDPTWGDARIAAALGCGHRTVERVRGRFVERGLEEALAPKARDYPSRPRKFGGAAQARRIAPACPQPPDGRARRAMKLLADELAGLGVFDSVSDETARRVPKKTNCGRTARSSG